MHGMDIPDTHLISRNFVERSSTAGLPTSNIERSQRHLDAEAFKRPLPRVSFGGYGETRPDNLRRESQATLSSVYSERTPSLGNTVLLLPANPSVGSPQSAQRQADPLRSEVLIEDIERAPVLSRGISSTSTQRISGPSLSLALQPRAFISQATGRSPEKSPLNAKIRAVHRQAPFVEELIHAFFARLHPYQLMFHQPTFQYRRYLNLVPSALLHMMYALAIRFIDPVTLHDALLAEHANSAEMDLPLFLAGEIFVNEAKQSIDAWVKQKSVSMRRASWSTGSLQTWEDLEMLMAITLCGFYEKAMSRTSDAAEHFGTLKMAVSRAILTRWLTSVALTDIAIDLLRDNLSIPASHNMGERHPDAVTLRRCTERTLWMLYLADVSLAVNVRPRQLLDYQMSSIPLPTNEAQFSWRGGCRTSAETQEMAYGVDALNLPGSAIPNADISEFGQLIRSVRLLTLDRKLR